MRKRSLNLKKFDIFKNYLLDSITGSIPEEIIDWLYEVILGGTSKMYQKKIQKSYVNFWVKIIIEFFWKLLMGYILEKKCDETQKYLI